MLPIKQSYYYFKSYYNRVVNAFYELLGDFNFTYLIDWFIPIGILLMHVGYNLNE